MVLNLVRAIQARANDTRLEEFDGALRRDVSLTGRDLTSALRSRYFRDPSSVLRWLCCQGPLRTQATSRGY
jgi:hypothetical protein